MVSQLIIKNSISTQLVRRIFGIYLLIAITVTIVQMFVEYNYIKEEIVKDIDYLQKSYSSSIAAAMWTFNANQIKSIMVGMNKIKSVVGVSIDDSKEQIHIGNIAGNQGKNEFYDKDGKQVIVDESKFFASLISYEFPIKYIHNNEIKHLGVGTIYSSSDIIFEQVKYGFMLILINSIVKTVALWILFVYFIRRLLSRPLNQFTEATQNLHLENLQNTKISVDTKGDNELKVLESAYNEMIEKLSAAKAELDSSNQNLEIKVAQRTRELEEEAKVRKLAQSEAEHASALKTMFLANMSHEIRTPMTSILGMAKILDYMETDEDKKHKLDIIVRNGDQLINIINDILDYSKAESNSLMFEQKEFAIRLCTQNIIELFAEQAKENGVSLVLNVNDAVPQLICGDATRLSQILTNLVGNALKFTEQGSVSINVDILRNVKDNGSNCGDQILFSIADTGIGIAQDKQSSLFDVFTQADLSTTRKYGGTGLGLAICKRYTELMGGTIWFESGLGKGSIFYFTISMNNHSNNLTVTSFDHNNASMAG